VGGWPAGGHRDRLEIVRTNDDPGLFQLAPKRFRLPEENAAILEAWSAFIEARSIPASWPDVEK
jgi:hypothetical protein